MHEMQQRRKRRQVFRMPDLKSGDPEFKSCSDRQLDLFQVVPGSTSQLCLYEANWSALCQLGFLTCSVHLFCSVTIYIVGPNQPIHQIKFSYYETPRNWRFVHRQFASHSGVCITVRTQE